MSQCKSCGASIVWAQTVNGKRMPVDELEVTGGNIRLSRAKQDPRDPPLVMATVVKPGEGTHRSHFSTCPGATTHRSKR